MVRILMGLMLVWAMSACSPTPQTINPADLVLRGGVVLTMDPEIGDQQAVAVKGHHIVAVGSNTVIDQLVGSDTKVIELNGRSVIPGLIEGHGHFLSLGRAQQVLDLTQADSFSDVVGKVSVAVDAAKPGEWILGMGWHQDKWAPGEETLVDGIPVNQTLNAASPENPVLLNHASGHAAFANEAALQAAGIDQTTADPAGGTIVRDSLGKATGMLRETAQRLIHPAYARYQAGLDPAELARQTDEQVFLAGRLALQHGITSFHDAGADFATIDYFRQLEDEKRLPVRLYVMIRRESNEDMAARLTDYRMPIKGNDFLTVRSIKRQIDGALGAHGAWLLRPYEDLPDTSGLVLEPIEDIEETARLAVEHGFQVNTHAIGTRANREVLDLYQRIWAENNTDGRRLRWRIEHAQHIHPEDVPRFGQLGVIAAVQGVHCTSDGPWIDSRLGQQRTEQTSYRWRDLLDSGAMLNNGTDAPVEHISPFASIQASVVRLMPNGEAFYPEQAMTLREALYTYTMGNAYSAFEEQHKGSITPGKLADLVVLNRNILAIAPQQIGQTRVELTVLGGEIVWPERNAEPDSAADI